MALRVGDLAYLHVHPDGAPGDGKTQRGPEIVFYATVPSTGSYRLFLDFRHGDTVRTAEFTLGTQAPAATGVPGSGAPTPGVSAESGASGAPGSSGSDGHGGHGG